MYMTGARYMRRSPDTPAKTMAKLAKIFSMYLLRSIHSFRPIIRGKSWLALCIHIERSRYSGCVCNKKKGRPRPLFNKQGMKAWKELEALVLDGHHGELPNVPRYQFMGRCPTTELRIFTCIVNSSWVESWHNQQRDSAAYGVGMIWADLMLHCAVDRWDVNAPRHPS